MICEMLRIIAIETFPAYEEIENSMIVVEDYVTKDI